MHTWCHSRQPCGVDCVLLGEGFFPEHIQLGELVAVDKIRSYTSGPCCFLASTAEIYEQEQMRASASSRVSYHGMQKMREQDVYYGSAVLACEGGTPDGYWNKQA